jgi:hypothetical protein
VRLICQLVKAVDAWRLLVNLDPGRTDVVALSAYQIAPGIYGDARALLFLSGSSEFAHLCF